VCERERGRERERQVTGRNVPRPHLELHQRPLRERVCEREIVCALCVCVREREIVCVRVCVCERERERESQFTSGNVPKVNPPDPTLKLHQRPLRIRLGHLMPLAESHLPRPARLKSSPEAGPSRVRTHTSAETVGETVMDSGKGTTSAEDARGDTCPGSYITKYTSVRT